jgi:hypothetical protein
MKAVIGFVALATLAGTAMASDISAVNSFKIENRTWNDYPTSVLNTTAAFPNVQWNEDFSNSPLPGPYANKHFAWLSDDGGASRFGLHGGGEGAAHNGQSFSITTSVNIAPTAGVDRRKEGALYIRNPRPALGYTDEGEVLVAGDNGEVAVFGGVMPFHSFGAFCYTPGTTASLKFTYFAPGTADPVKGAYRLEFTDAVTGYHDSGMKYWGTEPDGCGGFNNGTELGLFAQDPRASTVQNDITTFTYGITNLVPAPGSLALLGLGGLVAGRRRR